jgi:hypothetical protein
MPATTRMKTKRARCAFCRRLHGLDRAGKFYNHGPGPGDSFFCPGSERTPADAKRVATSMEAP